MTQIVNISDLLNGQKIVPVVVIENKQEALGLAQALI
ncbi:MAG: 2-keto-3-deoxy-6-phosphogluconate aldolase, partial [Arenicella sp.]